MNSMRVKLTFTFSTISTCTPNFIYVCGLTPKELPKAGCMFLPVEDLCIGIGGVSIGDKEKGYIILVRNNYNTDKHRYKHYRDEVLIPFIQSTRK